MIREEQETHIILNRADIAEGYFLFSTTVKTDYERLLRRIGGREKLISIKILTRNSDEVEWICRVPISYYSPGSFSVRRPCKNRGNPNFKPFKRKAA